MRNNFEKLWLESRWVQGRKIIAKVGIACDLLSKWGINQFEDFQSIYKII